MSNQTTMGKRIALLRKEKGMTQEQLAEKLGVSSQAVSKWENDISCPDIALLPLLASTLGISVDELLGTKPIEPHVVVVNNDKEAKKKAAFEWDFTGGVFPSIVFGCMLLLGGVIYLLSNLGVPIQTEGNFWWMVLSLGMVGIGIASFAKKFSIVGLAFLAFGGYLFYCKMINPAVAVSFNIIWPIAVILIAISIILSIVRGKKDDKYIVKGKKETKCDYSDEGGFVDADVSFGDYQKSFSGAKFTGADLEVSFGQLTLDLSDATDFENNSVIEVDVSFGTLIIKLPCGINVIKSVDNSFASCSMHGTPNANSPVTVFVKGDISFGSVDIRMV